MSTSSPIRHAIDEAYAQHGNCRGGRTRISWAPRSENKLATVPGEASGVELISGSRLARLPGEGRRSLSRAAGLPRSTRYKIMYGPAKKTWGPPPTTPGDSAVPAAYPSSSRHLRVRMRRRAAKYNRQEQARKSREVRESFHSVSRFHCTLPLAAPCQIRSRRAEVRAGFSEHQCLSAWRMCSSSFEVSCALMWRSPRDPVLSSDCGRKIGGRRNSPSRTIASGWLLGIGERDGGGT